MGEDSLLKRVAAAEERGRAAEKCDMTREQTVRALAGITIGVLDGDGNAVAGNAKLGTVRDSYADE